MVSQIRLRQAHKSRPQSRFAGGLLVVAATCTASRPDKLETQIREAAREAGRRLRLVDSLGLPSDFPTQMIYPLVGPSEVLFPSRRLRGRTGSLRKEFRAGPIG